MSILRNDNVTLSNLRVNGPGYATHTENIGSSISRHIDEFSLVNLTVSKTTSLNSSPRHSDEFKLVTLSKTRHFVNRVNRIYKVVANQLPQQ